MGFIMVVAAKWYAARICPVGKYTQDGVVRMTFQRGYASFNELASYDTSGYFWQ
jgi:hypothetical protein